MRPYAIPVVPLALSPLAGPIPARTVELGQTTKPLCLCNLQREKDRERLARKKR